MGATYRTETRHHPEGKVCHHFARYHMTCDEYDALRARAHERCEICRTPEGETGGHRLVIDHCWTREGGYVRGLLCDRCNAVMACMDGNKRWGSNRRWETRARSYAATPWWGSDHVHNALDRVT